MVSAQDGHARVHPEPMAFIVLLARLAEPAASARVLPTGRKLGGMDSCSVILELLSPQHTELWYSITGPEARLFHSLHGCPLPLPQCRELPPSGLSTKGGAFTR